MGYDTFFTGDIELTPTPTEEQISLLNTELNAMQLTDLGINPFTLDLDGRLVNTETRGEYVGWIQPSIDLLEDQGFSCTGKIYWTGEDEEDQGVITVTDNKVSVLNGTIIYHEFNLPLNRPVIITDNYEVLLIPDQVALDAVNEALYGSSK